MCEPEEEFDYTLIEPIPGLRFFYGDEDYLRIRAERKVAEIRARKAQLAAERERSAS